MLQLTAVNSAPSRPPAEALPIPDQPLKADKPSAVNRRNLIQRNDTI
jgi:hypothetical protein